MHPINLTETHTFSLQDISVYFKMIRYTLKNISGTQSMVSYNLYIIVVIMKGIARVIDKSTRYFWINLVSVQILNIVLSIEPLTRSGQGQLVITKSVVNLYYFKTAR